MGSYTPNFNLYKPNIDETGWGDEVNQNFDIIDDELTAAKILEKLKNVDGAGSGLDADLLDGKHASDFVPVSSDSDISISISGTQVLNISSAGILTLPKQNICVVRLGTNQSITAGTWTKVALDTVEIDTQNEFDSTNNRVTVSDSGKYLCIGVARFAPAGAAGDALIISLKVNGVERATTVLQAAEAQAHTLVISKIFNLSAGDYIELYVQDANSDTTLEGASYATFLSVAKIA